MFNPVIGAGNPLAPPLRVEHGEEGITAADEPDVPLVEADAHFLTLRLDQARRLFVGLASPGGPEAAHD